MDKHIYVMGGYEGMTLRYTPDSNTWSALSRTLWKHGFGAAVVYNNQLLVMGGKNKERDRPGSMKPHCHIEVYDTQTDRWAPWITKTCGTFMCLLWTSKYS